MARAKGSSWNTRVILCLVLVFLKDVGAQVILTESSKTTACPGDELTFKCETRGSMILAWSSEEYIGTGGVQLEFTTEDTPGFIQTSDTHPDTVATLISSDQRLLNIISTLQIVVSSNVSMSHPSSVTCEHRTSGTNRMLTFQHLAIPGPPLEPVALEVENAQNREGCVIFVEWSPPANTFEEDVDYYIIDFPSGTISSIQSFVTFSLHVHKCTQEIIIKVRAVNRCGDVGNYSQNIKPTRLDGYPYALLIVGVALVVVGIVLILLAIIIVIVIWWRVRKHGIQHQHLNNEMPLLDQTTTETSFENEINGKDKREENGDYDDGGKEEVSPNI